MPSSLGLQERFELAAAHCGFTPLIILSVLCREPVEDRLENLLLHNIQALLAACPNLKGGILDRLSRKPAWYVPDGAHDALSMIHFDSSSTATLEDLIQEGSVQGQGFDLDRGPLWRVSVRKASDTPDLVIILTVSHIIMDGSGALELLKLLLRDPALIDHPLMPEYSIPRAEDTMKMQPTYFEALTKIGKKILPEIVPAFIRGFLPVASVWPTANMLARSPIECTPCRHLLSFGCATGSVLPGLKKFSKVSGVGSVQSLLHTACMMAFLSAFQKVRQGGSGNIRAVTETPIALRNATSQHPRILGNYAALVEFSIDIESARHQTFSQMTTTYHSQIHSVAGRKAAMRHAGMIGWIPDLPYLHTPTYVLDGPKVTPAPTGLESFLIQQAASTTPYRASFAVSNLGLLNLDEVSGVAGDKLHNLYFTQTPMPWGAAFYIDIVGSPARDPMLGSACDELGIVVSCLEGAFDKDFELSFVQNLSKAIRSIADAGSMGLVGISPILCRRMCDLVTCSPRAVGMR